MGLLDNIKAIAKTVRQIDNIDLNQQILDLQSDALDMLEENGRLKVELEQANQRLNIRDKLIFSCNMYYLPGKDGKKDGPFCSSCYDASQNLIRLHSYKGFWGCPQCGRLLNNDSGIEPSASLVHAYHSYRSSM